MLRLKSLAVFLTFALFCTHSNAGKLDKLVSKLVTGIRKCTSIVDDHYGLTNPEKTVVTEKKITAKNIRQIFTMQADTPNYRWAKGAVVLSAGKPKPVFWGTGDHWGFPTHVGHREFLLKYRSEQNLDFALNYKDSVMRRKIPITEDELLSVFGFQLTAEKKGESYQVIKIQLSSTLDERLAEVQLPIPAHVLFNAFQAIVNAIDPKLLDLRELEVPRLKEINTQRLVLQSMLETLKNPAAPSPKR